MKLPLKKIGNNDYVIDWETAESNHQKEMQGLDSDDERWVTYGVLFLTIIILSVLGVGYAMG